MGNLAEVIVISVLVAGIISYLASGHFNNRSRIEDLEYKVTRLLKVDEHNKYVLSSLLTRVQKIEAAEQKKSKSDEWSLY
jgi:hypothetical protein